MIFVLLFVIFIMTLVKEILGREDYRKEQLRKKQRSIDMIKSKAKSGKTIIDTTTKIHMEYLNEQLEKEYQEYTEKLNLKNILIWQVQKVHQVNSYSDIVPRLLEYRISNDYANIMELLDLLNKLNVDTEEILDENPNILPDLFSTISNQQTLRTQIV